MNRYLVISFSDDRSQFYFDVLTSESEDKAKELIEESRPYIYASEVLTLHHIDDFQNRMVNSTTEQIDRIFKRRIKDDL